MSNESIIRNRLPSRSPRVRVWRAGVLLVAVMAACFRVARADEATTRYFEQLRQRGLYRLAEGVCYRELARKDTTPDQRTQWTLELSRTLAARAKYRAGQEQTDLWKQAVQVIDNFLKDEPSPPRRGWLKMQRAVVFVVEGEFRRWEAELYPYKEAVRRKAEKALARAEQSLRQLEAEYLSGRGKVAAGINPGERAQLLRHTRYQLALTKIQQAELFAKDSAARKAAVDAAVDILRPLTLGAKDHIVTLNSRLLLAMAGRLQGDPKTAGDRLKVLLNQKPPLSLKFRILAEVVRNNLDAGQMKRADAILNNYGKHGYLPGELAFLKVKTSIALWDSARKSGDTAKAEKFLKQAEADVKNVEQFLGGYWAWRCRALFDFLKEAKTYGPELAAAIQRAESSYHSRQIATAIREYRAAGELALKQKQAEAAARMLYTTASLELEAGQFDDAAETFKRVPPADPKGELAAKADVMAAYCLGRHYDALRSKDRRLAYTHALEQHRKRYAESPTRHEAAWMLAGLQDYRNQTSEALKLYLSIPANHPRGSQAQAEAGRCFEEIIDRIRELKRPKELKTWEAHAAFHLRGFIEDFPKSPSAWSRLQATVALRTARIELNRSPPRYRAAEPLLGRILESAKARRRTANLSQSDREWWAAAVRSARQLQILALAGNGQFDVAEDFLASLSNAGPAEVLAVLDGLMKLGKSTNERLRRDLGNLQLRTALELDKRRGKLGPAEQKWLDRCLAQAYSATGRVGNAVEKYEKLLEKSPRSRRHLKSAATLLGKSTQRDVLLKSQSYWRRLEALEQPGSEAWFEARYQAAAVRYRLSDVAGCLKTLRKTRLIYPNLGGGAMKQRFEKLEATAKARSSE